MAHLLKLHRGSEPNPTYVGMIWFDNASNQIKVCTSAPENGTPTWEIYGGSVEIEIAEGKNFLNMEDDGGLAVRSIDTNKTLVNEAITIEGGPLATPEIKALFANGTITEDMNVQEILLKLFCKEIYNDPEANTPEYTVSISAPSITATDVTDGDLVEKGQTITFNAVTANGVATSAIDPQVSGFHAKGYSSSLNGEITTNTSVGTSWSISQKANTNYALTPSKTGFTTGTLPNSASNAAAASCQLTSCALTADLGTNTYSVKEDAPAYTGSHSGIPVYYVVSNLGNRSESEKSPAIVAASNVEKTAESQTTTFTVTGVYPVFTNAVAGKGNTSTADTKCPLTAGNVIEIEYANETLAFHQFVFPETHELSTVEIWNPQAKQYEEYLGGSVTTDTTRTVQNVSTDYKLWTRDGSKYSDSTKFKFTLNKNLNQ